MREIFNKIAEKAEKVNPRNEGDYIGTNGLLYCGVCHTQKQSAICIGGETMIVPCMCDCAAESKKAEQEIVKAAERERRRKDTFSGGALMQATFANDDRKNEKLSQIARACSEKLSPLSDWLLLYGGMGCGKSYIAAAIANSIIDKDMSVIFTTLPELERQLWDTESKQAVYNKLSHCDLLVLDDLGAERKTDYMSEITFTVIDNRLRSGLPCVITSNLSPQELFAPADLDMRRIMSRVCEKSLPVLCSGIDRRFDEMKTNAEKKLAELLKTGGAVEIC